MEEPLGLAARPNVYAYANNDPLNLLDRLGLCGGPSLGQQIAGGALIALGGIIDAAGVLGAPETGGASLLAEGEGTSLIAEGGALLDTNAVIAAVENGNAAAVDASLAGNVPYVSPTVASEFAAGSGNLDALTSFLTDRGSGMLGAETEGNALGLQNLATSMGRSLGANDAAIGSAAQSNGIPVITNDSRFANFLNAAGIGARGF